MAVLVAFRKVRALLSPVARRKALALCLCTLVNAATELSGVAGLVPLLAVAADPALVQQNPTLSRLYAWSGCTSFEAFFALLGILFLLLFTLTTLVNTLTWWFTYRLTTEVSSDLSLGLLRRYLHRPHVWHLGQNTSRLTRIVLHQVDDLVHRVVRTLATMTMRAMTSLFLCAGLLWLDYRVALTTGVALSLLFVAIYSFFNRQMERLGKECHEAGHRRTRIAMESLSALREAKALPRRRHFLESYRRAFDRETELRLKRLTLGEISRPCTEILALAAIVTVLVYLCITHTSRAALPLVGAYVMAAWRLVPCLQCLYEDLVDLQFRLPLVEEIYSELTDPEPPVPDEGGPPLPFNRAIELRRVEFTYPGATEPAVRGLELTIPRNSSVALVGRTGSGKTTVADLVAGLLTPGQGRLLIDGQPLSPQDLTRWHQSIGYVPQEIYLTDDTLRRNIALGVPDEEIDEQAVERAARAAHLHGFIASRPEGYDTLVGERGVALSGGERQRIGIARALYHEPELLILDEATSALDNQTERWFLEALAELAHSKTLLVIAHRLSTVQACDQIYLLNEGQVEARGTYQELLLSSPQFQELARLP